jgi:azurin
MKATLISSLLIAASLFAGCSKPESAPAASTPAAAAPTGGPRTVNIQAGDTMKYDVTQIEAAPGEELKVVLTNAGTQPKEIMGHNWVLLKAGADPVAFVTAASTAKDTGYIPAALQDQIIAHIDQLGPKQSGDVTFKAPAAPGEYPFFCSFPAHYLIGMKGVLVVK